MVKPGINWRSRTDINEENRHGHYRDGTPKAVAVMTLTCEGCGKEITEVQFSDGHRSYDSHGVRSVLGKGVYCRSCPDGANNG